MWPDFSGRNRETNSQGKGHSWQQGAELIMVRPSTTVEIDGDPHPVPFSRLHKWVRENICTSTVRQETGDRRPLDSSQVSWPAVCTEWWTTCPRQGRRQEQIPEVVLVHLLCVLAHTHLHTHIIVHTHPYTDMYLFLSHTDSFKI